MLRMLAGNAKASKIDPTWIKRIISRLGAACFDAFNKMRARFDSKRKHATLFLVTVAELEIMA